MLSVLQKSPDFIKKCDYPKKYIVKPYITVGVVPASTDVRVSITDRSRILTVEITVVTAWTTSVIRATVSATVEAVVVVLVADLIVSRALRVLHTGGCLTEVVVTLVAGRAVVRVNTA